MTKSTLAGLIFVCMIAISGAAPVNAANKQEGKQATSQTYSGAGVIKQVKADKGAITIEHGPIDGLSWPAMTMDFEVADKKLLERATPGQKVKFLLQESKGKYVIVKLAVQD